MVIDFRFAVEFWDNLLDGNSPWNHLDVLLSTIEDIVRNNSLYDMISEGTTTT